MDIAAVRSKFPALDRGQVFFDNAGGSQTLGAVIDSIRDYLSNTNVQLGASYHTSQRSTSLYAQGIAAGARYINASPSEVVFGSSTTQLLRNLSFALRFSPGDEIVVSLLDHEANVCPWVDLAERQGLVIKWWRGDGGDDNKNPKLTPESLAPLLSPRTRLVTATHASNLLGTITDVPALSALVHGRFPRAGTLLCVDAVAYAPHRALDVKALGVDFYCFSWYKVYGPHVAMLYAAKRPRNGSDNGGGGGGEAQFPPALASLGHYFKRKPGATLEDHLGLAGGSYELVQAIPQVVDYLSSSSSSAFVAQEAALQARLLAYLTSFPSKFTIYGEADPSPDLRVPTISFTVDGWRSRDVVEAFEALQQQKKGEEAGKNLFGFRWGSFYSSRLAGEVLKLADPDDGIVRVSMVHYNTVEELERFIALLDEVLGG